MRVRTHAHVRRWPVGSCQALTTNTPGMPTCDLQIYNERVYDLLADVSAPARSAALGSTWNSTSISTAAGAGGAADREASLNLREHSSRGVYVEGLTEVQVSNVAEALSHLSMGLANRRVAATNMNRESSRSHCVFTISLESQETRNGTVRSRNSCLHVIDLAGSERQKRTGATDSRLKEAAQINKSLSCLASVISSLVEVAQGKARHVPYRDSKLTYLLRDSLGGNSRTSLIATVSPMEDCYSETVSTLKFAESAKQVRVVTACGGRTPRAQCAHVLVHARCTPSASRQTMSSRAGEKQGSIERSHD
ncbi:hypothetical protein EON66_04705 [archaeon]|nr:MAG: hypothetical protein EON66_04705 [archaeon]